MNYLVLLKKVTLFQPIQHLFDGVPVQIYHDASSQCQVKCAGMADKHVAMFHNGL